MTTIGYAGHMATRPLTPKQQRFVDEYLIDLNATQAAIRAGYSERAASVSASRLLANAKVSEAIRSKKKSRSKRTQVDTDRVVRELSRIAFLDPGDVLDFSGDAPRLKAPNQIPAHARRAISKIKVKRYFEGSGDDAREVEMVEFGFWDKNSALEKLGKHLGIFVDRHQIEEAVRVVITEEEA
jgi:phage terminase small subunit